MTTSANDLGDELFVNLGVGPLGVGLCGQLSVFYAGWRPAYRLLKAVGGVGICGWNRWPGSATVPAAAAA